MLWVERGERGEDRIVAEIYATKSYLLVGTYWEMGIPALQQCYL